MLSLLLRVSLCFPYEIQNLNIRIVILSPLKVSYFFQNYAFQFPLSLPFFYFSSLLLCTLKHRFLIFCAHAYRQVPLTKEAREKTTFVEPDRKGEFTRMVFGVTNAPFVFAQLMEKALGSLRNTVVMCYMDDLIVPARNWIEMLERLRRVFEVLRTAGLTLKPTKCYFGKQCVDFLGYVLSTEGISPGTTKLEAISKFPHPNNIHEMRRFLGW